MTLFLAHLLILDLSTRYFNDLEHYPRREKQRNQPVFSRNLLHDFSLIQAALNLTQKTICVNVFLIMKIFLEKTNLICVLEMIKE